MCPLGQDWATGYTAAYVAEVSIVKKDDTNHFLGKGYYIYSMDTTYIWNKINLIHDVIP